VVFVGSRSGFSPLVSVNASTARPLCPFHPDKHPSLFVAPEKQAWFCFGCKAGGDVQEFERLYADRIPP